MARVQAEGQSFFTDVKDAFPIKPKCLRSRQSTRGVYSSNQDLTLRHYSFNDDHVDSFVKASQLIHHADSFGGLIRR